MAAIDNLTQAKLNITALMESITASPKPSYSVDGESVSWSEYLSMLTTQLEAINRAIVIEGGPVQIVTTGVT